MTSVEWLRTNPADEVSRREALALGAGAIAVAGAGCTRASEFLVERVVGDLNVFNTTGTNVTGAIDLVDPDGRTLLEERFELAADDGDESESAAIYDDTLTEMGTYDLGVAFESTDGTESASIQASVRVTAPDEEHVVVFLGRRFTDESITVTVVEDFSELEGVMERDGQ